MVMGIDVVDHIILADQRYCSLLEVGAIRQRSSACATLLIRLRIVNALYFDCFSGASGDMILGALIDAGVKLEDVRAGARQPGDRADTVWTERGHAAAFARRSSASGARRIRCTDDARARHHDHAHARPQARARDDATRCRIARWPRSSV